MRCGMIEFSRMIEQIVSGLIVKATYHNVLFSLLAFPIIQLPIFTIPIFK